MTDLQVLQIKLTAPYNLQEKRYGGTVNPSAMSMWLSNTELLTRRHSWTRNCEMHLAVRLGTSIKLRFLTCREDKPLRNDRSGRQDRCNVGQVANR
jgi:hypothetical protein